MTVRGAGTTATVGYVRTVGTRWVPSVMNVAHGTWSMACPGRSGRGGGGRYSGDPGRGPAAPTRGGVGTRRRRGDDAGAVPGGRRAGVASGRHRAGILRQVVFRVDGHSEVGWARRVAR